MTLEHFFDAAFVINLPSRFDRLIEFGGEWFYRFRTPMGCAVWEGCVHPASANHGCSNSHRTLLKRISESSFERVLILEDDCAVLTSEALLTAGFGPNQESPVWDTFHKVPGRTLNDRFDFLSPHIPADWDVIYLGAGYGEPPLSRANEFCLRVGFTQTTSSYGVTRDFAKKFTAHLDEHLGSLDNYPGPADNMLSQLSREFKYYCLQPRLCYQRESFSDIAGRATCYIQSMTDPTHERMV